MMQIAAWVIVGWVFTCCAATFSWCLFVEVCRWQERRRRDLALSRLPTAARQRGAHPVRHHADRALPLAPTPCQVRPRDEGTAPVDRAAIPELGVRPTTCP